MIRRWTATVIFWTLLAAYICLMWVMMWAAENMDFEPEYE